MKQIYTWGVMAAIGLLAGCASPSEKQGLEAVAQFYGGSVSFTKGANVTTTKADAQGKYLEISLHSAGLTKRYSDMRMPASNCAYMVYDKLAPAEQQAYDYLKVSLNDSADAHSYTFRKAELVMVEKAAVDLNAFLIDLQTEDHAKVQNAFNLDILDAAAQKKLPDELAKIEKALAPITDYRVEGYAPVTVEVGNQKVQLVRFYITLVHAGKTSRMALVINPEMHLDQPFLYGIQA
ncbi:hypothetical protein Q5H92_14435 [Hymenobacter sp. M29]|uniref:Lipoprotein n=1 Tax=Hymenobacter mellowenesis TaxID=3063995 RepID=A0ABT9ADW8_9BACT|nr:hypothetical protein [Hymenobacter sp. M29]MDO7847564.1 hypothetical protein [Hymenobacter sp. M29]